MADRYWVGGTGSWNSTAKWSTTSGGASGASVPTATDNAIFDANSATSNAYVVTIQASQTCADLTYTPFAGDGATQFLIIGTFVIAGTFSTSGTQGNRRLWLRSSTESLMRDVSIATIGTVTDVDFRDIRITGAGGTLTGTRIGDLKGNGGITFSTPKNCFRIGTGNWSDDQWSDTSGGSVSTDNFPLAQDTAVFDENTSAGTHTMNSAIPYTGTVDMSARTSAMSLSVITGQTIFGNWTFGSGITITGGSSITFSGRNTQTITNAGRTFSASFVVNSYGGTVELADAYNGNSINVNNGTFITNNYNVTIINSQYFNATSSTPAAILLGSSTVTITGSMTVTTTNFTFDAGTSTIIFSGNGPILDGALTLYNVQETNLAGSGLTVKNSCTFNNLEITAPTSLTKSLKFGDNQVITGTLTVSGASEIRRLFVLASDISNNSEVGVTRTLTVGTLLADYCDFRDITIAGTAAGGSPTNAGDCGGNSGVTFPAPKTVYWNLSGTRSWEANGWATTSGGTPDAANFPLAQDTAVFDDTGAASIVNMRAFNVGAVDMSARTTSMSLSAAGLTIYGDWSFGTGVSNGSSAGITFAGQGTTTITSNGVEFSLPVTFDCATGTVQLADAFAMPTTRTLTLTSGSFDAVSYNVTAGRFGAGGTSTLKMGSGTWTLTSTGTVWNMGSAGASFSLDIGTADILLSSTSASARTFDGSGKAFGKLTIGGATGSSTTTLSGGSTYAEIASTKPVAHTIALGTGSHTFGKWSVTGTSGNVVTVTGTGTSNAIAGSRVSGVDYLAMGTIGFIVTSGGEFYAGANSTGTGQNVILSDAPTPVTRYWVGGAGTWNATSTTNWSATSGGAGGESVPTSADAVIFDSASNATAYAVNFLPTGATILRCGSLTIAGPASGDVTIQSSGSIVTHGNITLPATGLNRTYTGTIYLSGSTAGKTITTNGVSLVSTIFVNGIGAEWALADALENSTQSLTVNNGTFSTAGFNFTTAAITSNGQTNRTINFGSSTVSVSGNFAFGTSISVGYPLTFIAGTSQINLSASSPTIQGNNKTFYNVSYTSASTANFNIQGANTFNNLSVVSRTTAGVTNITVYGDQTINGTLTLSAGTDATMRTFLKSDTIGATRTLTCGAVDTLTDIDFRNITIAGAAVSGGNLTGTRLGDGKGNSGITFDAGVNKYWNLAGNGNWSSTVWATSSGGAVSNDNFPLAQDTCIFEAGSPNSGNTATINATYNIGTIDMSARTTNTMTLACAQIPSIYGNWINGTGTTLSGTGTLTFAGRGSQTITSAGRTFTQGFTIDTPGGSVTLQDAFETNRASATALLLTSGTFDANGYAVTASSAIGGFGSSNSNPRTLAFGSNSTWTIAGTSNSWNTAGAGNLTITGTGVVNQTAGGAKTFSGGSSDYSGITVNQGGSGTLTITGNNSFANITNTYSATGATTISFGTSTQNVANFTASGTAGNVLTIQGSSELSPCNLIHTGAGDIILDYLNLIGVRAYQI
jgi:fibronectin-binding autotransporter adhesin